MAKQAKTQARKPKKEMNTKDKMFITEAAKAKKAKPVAPIVAEKLAQLTDIMDMTREEIEKADKTAYIDLSQVPPKVLLGGFWRGVDIRNAKSALNRAYHINRGVLKLKSVGAKEETKRKKPLKGKAAIEARDARLKEARDKVIRAKLAEEEVREAKLDGIDVDYSKGIIDATS